jgi:iron complex transport system substrate-binding protein
VGIREAGGLSRRGALRCAVGAALAAATDHLPGFPLSIPNCGQALRLDRPPQRAVIHDINMTAMALALGLQPYLVGVTGITGWHRPDDAFRAALGSVPELSPRYPTLEVLLAARADFFFAGWHYGLRPGGELTPATLARHGIATLILSESCAHLNPRPARATMALLFDDMLRLGEVFGHRARAEALVAGWRQQLGALPAGLAPADADRPRVFVYDTGRDKPFTAGRAAMPTALIDAAGGRNIMDDLAASWAHTAWETVGIRDPQLVILSDYQRGRGLAAMRQQLTEHPAMRRVEAVRKGRYLALPYAQLTPGPANLEAIGVLARSLRDIRP